jgi:predicted nucleic acid-binding protein
VRNAIYRYHRAGYLSLATTEMVVDAALGLPVIRESPAPLHTAAIRLAAEARLPASCDAHYMALARLLDADLWTADARLAREVGEDGRRINVLRART